MDKPEKRRLALKELVATLGRGGVRMVADGIGKAPNYVSRMLYEPHKPGRKKISEDSWDLLVAAFPSELGEFNQSLTTHGVTGSETPITHVRFPLLEGYAGMGRGDYVGDYPEIVDFVEVTKEWASQKLRGVPFEAVRVITGRGQSMRGTYNDGDLVFLDSRIKQFKADAAYCYRWEGMVHIKRLQHIGRGKVRIISSNPEWPPIDVDLKELEIGGLALAAWTLQEF